MALQHSVLYYVIKYRDMPGFRPELPVLGVICEAFSIANEECVVMHSKLHDYCRGE